MKIAIAQITALSDLNSNLKTIASFIQQAKSQGTELIVFPEMAYFSGKKEDWLPIAARYPELLDHFSRLAREHSIALVPGTLREPTEAPDKFYNTLPFIDSNGKILTVYRKIFLYKAYLPDRNYDETVYSKAGDKLVTLDWHGIKIGFSICFDLRFPELFRSLKKLGAQLVLVPAAFTVPTGKAHWEILLRARAIENQFFVLAPGLTGTSGDGAEKYGHSLAINPWGEILTDLKTDPGFKTVEINPSEITEAEKKVPAWTCRREDLFKFSL